MLIKIQFVPKDGKLPDNLTNLPYEAMLSNDSHVIDWWTNFEQCPSAGHKPNAHVRPLGVHTTITVLHRFAHQETDEEMKWYSILRHYKRVNWYNHGIMQSEFTGYIVFDAKVDYDMQCDPSLLSMLWLFPDKVRAEVDFPSIERSWWGFPGLIEREEKNKEELAAISAGGEMAETERQLEVDRRTLQRAIVVAVKDTAKAIKRLQEDMLLGDMRRRDQLKEAREMMPFLRRSRLGKILGTHAIEPEPNCD